MIRIKLIANKNTVLKIHKICNYSNQLHFKENSIINDYIKTESGKISIVEVEIDNTMLNNEIQFIDDINKKIITINYESLLTMLEEE